MSDELTEAGGKTRLYVTGDLGEGVAVALDEGQSHYLLHVLRAKTGNRVSLFNGRDGEWLAQINVGKRAVIATCLRRTREQAGVPDLWLAFAPVKKTPADYLVQKAAELGVSCLLPVFTRRTIVTRVNLERMTANAVEAAEQSERLTVPEVREPVNFERLLAGWPKERRLYFCDEGGDARPLAKVLRDLPPPLGGGGIVSSPGEEAMGEGQTPKPDIDVPSISSPLPHAALRRAPSREGRGIFPAAILTGPEGGFDPSERDALRALPFVTSVTLGPRILRADTAALAALAIWQSVAGDFA